MVATPHVSRQDFHLYLLIGQSNMAGRAEIEEQDRAPLERVYLLNDKDEWEIATNPLNRYSTIRKDLSMQKLGPGYTFGRALAAARPEIAVGLIVNVRGGSSIDEWVKGSEFFREAVRRTRKARESGALKGVLWHQGESDRLHPTEYLPKLAVLIGDLRTDLDAASLPFVAGQIGAFVDDSTDFNNEIVRLPAQVPFTEWVGAEGLSDRGDRLHFDSRSQRLLGERYAEKILEMVYRDS